MDVEKGVCDLNNDRKMSLSDFKKKMQCSPREPDIEGNRGVISMIKHLNMSSDAVEAICAWVVSGCEMWYKCHQALQNYKDEKIPFHNKNWPHDNVLWLYRIINGSLYSDWPWKRKDIPHLSKNSIILKILSMVNDFKDSVFLMGLENPLSPTNFPFPIFTNSPSYTSSDLVIPWSKSYLEAYRNHKLVFKSNSKTNDLISNQYNRTYHGNDPSDDTYWNTLQNIAWFGGNWIRIRSNIYFLATLRPDLLHVVWTGIDYSEYRAQPLNPSSREDPDSLNIHTATFESVDNSGHKYMENGQNVTRFGYLNSVSHYRIKKGASYKGYKYVVVLKGRANADRLHHLLVHSGCVLLIQATDQIYHFSTRLVAWVHYVPLAYNVADVLDKILWLRNNDQMARQIAINARNFAHSYLRLEDYYCYMAEVFKQLGDALEGTAAIRPFSPRPFELDG